MFKPLSCDNLLQQWWETDPASKLTHLSVDRPQALGGRGQRHQFFATSHAGTLPQHDSPNERSPALSGSGWHFVSRIDWIFLKAAQVSVMTGSVEAPLQRRRLFLSWYLEHGRRFRNVFWSNG